jgi:hypothetical protein
MATGKKSFVLYSDQKELFEHLTDEQSGKLIKHIFRYVNDENPTCEDAIVNLAFITIKASLKRDLQKWEKQLEQRSAAGKASAKSRQRKSTSVNERQRNSTDSVNVSVSVNDNVNEKKEKEVYVSFGHLSITKGECIKLSENYTKKQIDTILESIQNYKPNKKYTSLYLTAKNWLKKEYGDNGRQAKEVDAMVEHVRKMTGT